MKNKNGFLLGEETLKVVIAVICILFLVYLLAHIYYTNKDSRDLKLATASLENLIRDINSGKNSTEVYNPSGWRIVSWDGENTPVEVTGAKIPASCLNMGWSSCLCICKPLRSSGISKNVMTPKLCDDNGICLKSSFAVEASAGANSAEGVIGIENPPVQLEIDQVNGVIGKNG